MIKVSFYFLAHKSRKSYFWFSYLIVFLVVVFSVLRYYKFYSLFTKNYLFIYYVIEMEYCKFYNIITNVSQFKKINNK